MRLFTTKGDGGMTDLLGDRVRKDHPIIELLGDLDEATSALGLGRALSASPRTKETVIEVQRDLYKILAELAFTEEIRPATYSLDADRVQRLEALTDALSAEIELPREFIVPGESVAGAALDVARTVVRRAERTTVRLTHEEIVTNPQIVRYLNRLSSLAFMLARFEDREAGVTPMKAKTSSNS